jgi:hypothetical protein
MSNQTLLSLMTFFYPDYNCRPRNCTGSCPIVTLSVAKGLVLEILRRFAAQNDIGLAGCTADRELHPAPKVDILLNRL